MKNQDKISLGLKAARFTLLYLGDEITKYDDEMRFMKYWTSLNEEGRILTDNWVLTEVCHCMNYEDIDHLIFKAVQNNIKEMKDAFDVLLGPEASNDFFENDVRKTEIYKNLLEAMVIALPNEKSGEDLLTKDYKEIVEANKLFSHFGMDARDVDMVDTDFFGEEEEEKHAIQKQMNPVAIMFLELMPEIMTNKSYLPYELRKKLDNIETYVAKMR